MDLQEKLAAVQKKLDKQFPGYSDAINGMTNSELKEQVVQMNKNIEEIDLAKGADEKLEEAQALVAELKAPYEEASKKAKMKLQFMNLLLKSKTDVA